MRVALWSYAYLDLVEDALQRAARGARESVECVRAPAAKAAEYLVAGEVDIALIPTTTVLVNTEGFDVLPAFAVSSWNYPFARINLPEGLGAIPGTLLVDERGAEEAFVSVVVLKEHYGRPVEVKTIAADDFGDEELSLVIKEDYDVPDSALDLGREWYELANYPMVWGVFAVRKGEADILWMRIVRDAAAIADKLRTDSAASEEDVARREFLHDDLRFRFDDLATASVAELSQYLFYYHGHDEVAELPVVHLPEYDEEHDEDVPLV